MKQLIKPWSEYHADVRKLAEKLIDVAEKGGFEWVSIVTVPRGAMVPAAMVARELNLRVVENLCLSSYDREKQGREVKVLKRIGTGFLKSLNLSEKRRLILIDDLADTGDTLRVVKRELGAYAWLAHFAVVYVKPAGRPMADTFVEEVPQDVWIRQPWDMDYQYAKPLVGET